MSFGTIHRPQAEVVYPDSDGQPMADNTKQYEWITTIKDNLEAIFADRADVFVAGDLLWYAVEGDPTIRTAPDVLVALGRPKGHRGSYRQWEEGGIAPQVAFEICSPGNRPGDLTRKFQFYQRHGVEEYYLYDPDSGELSGWLRQGAELVPIPDMQNWVSPRLQIRFEPGPSMLNLYRPDGQRFLTFTELMQQRNREEQLKEQAQRQAEQAQRQAEHERQLREQLQKQLDEQNRLVEQLQAQLRQREDRPKK